MDCVPSSKIWGGLKSVGCADVILNGNKKKGQVPELWDGHAAQRIIDILGTLF